MKISRMFGRWRQKEETAPQAKREEPEPEVPRAAPAAPPPAEAPVAESPPVGTDTKVNMADAVQSFLTIQEVLGGAEVETAPESGVAIPVSALLMRLPEALRGPAWQPDNFPPMSFYVEREALLERLRDGRLVFRLDHFLDSLPAGWVVPDAQAEVELDLPTVVAAVPPELLAPPEGVVDEADIVPEGDLFTPKVAAVAEEEAAVVEEEAAAVEEEAAAVEEEAAAVEEEAVVVEEEAVVVEEEAAAVEEEAVVVEEEAAAVEEEAVVVEEEAAVVEEKAVVVEEKAVVVEEEAAVVEEEAAVVEEEAAVVEAPVGPPVPPPVAAVPAPRVETVEPAPPSPEKEAPAPPVPAPAAGPSTPTLPGIVPPELVASPWDGVEASIESAPNGVDLNSASLAELARLPRVGQVLARGIIAYRQTHAPFESVFDLLNVPGVGPVTFAAMTGLSSRTRRDRHQVLAGLLGVPSFPPATLPEILEAIGGVLGAAGSLVTDRQGIPIAAWGILAKTAEHHAAICSHFCRRVGRYLHRLDPHEGEFIFLPAASPPVAIHRREGIVLVVAPKTAGLSARAVSRITGISRELAWRLRPRAIVRGL